MMRLHCDKCDAVINGKYFEVREHSACGVDIVGAFATTKFFCPDCLKGMNKDANGSNSLGSCAECKYNNKAPYEEPCKTCSHCFMNHFEQKEDPEDVPSEQ